MRVSRLAVSLTLFGLLSQAVIAQDSPPPPGPQSRPTHPTPTDSPGQVPNGTPREAELEARVRQLEDMVHRLSRQVDLLSVTPPPLPAPAAAPAASPAPAQPVFDASIPSGTPGQGTFPNPGPSDRFRMPARTRVNPLGVARFGPGFEWKTDDDEFVLQFHDLTQVDGRFYSQAGQDPVTDTFAIPRQWFIWSGRLTKPYEYFVSLQNGFDNLGLLDDFLNVHYDDRLQFKVGRYKTPFTYEFFQLPVQGLITPERSLFFNNFALNRAIGTMIWGRLFDKKLDYATGIFNTNRNGLIDTSDGKAVLAYLNYRPFAASEGSLLENFNLGGSVDSGNRFGTPLPDTLRTVVPTTGNAVAGLPFLQFDPMVIQEAGNYTMWDVHAALYYKHLSLVGEWGSGRQNYSPIANANNRTRVPVSSWYVQAGYFVTGETVSFRGLVEPIRDFDLRPGRFGLGALEIFARYDILELGDVVFTNQLANPADWTDRVYLTDLGFNWYWTQYIKFVFDWEHSEFATPVLFAPGKRHINDNLFWFRFQIFF